MESIETNKDELSLRIAALESELEIKRQGNHEFKSKLGLIFALEEDYLAEIEALQSNSQLHQLRNKFKQLEEYVANHKHIDENADIQKKKEEIEHLQTQITNKKATNTTTKDRYLEMKKLQKSNKLVLDRNLALKSEAACLKNNLLEIDNCIKQMEMGNNQMHESIMVNNNAVLEIKQEMEIKHEYLEMLKNKIDTIQEEVAVARLDLEAAKCKPSDCDKRGNSLFAEVDDSRIKMQQQIHQLKHHYETIKRDLQKKMALKAALRKQLVECLDGLNGMESCSAENNAIQSYRSEIRGLEKYIEQFRNQHIPQLKSIGNKLVGHTIEFANCSLRSLWQEVTKTTEALNSDSIQLLDNCIKLHTAKKEQLDQKLIVLQLKAEIEELKNEILEKQLQNYSPKLEIHTDISVNMRGLDSRNSIVLLDTHSEILDKRTLIQSTDVRKAIKNLRTCSLATVLEDHSNEGSIEILEPNSCSHVESNLKFKSSTMAEKVGKTLLKEESDSVIRFQSPETESRIAQWVEQSNNTNFNKVVEPVVELVECDPYIASLTDNLQKLCIEPDIEESLVELTNYNTCNIIIEETELESSSPEKHSELNVLPVSQPSFTSVEQDRTELSINISNAEINFYKKMDDDGSVVNCDEQVDFSNNNLKKKDANITIETISGSSTSMQSTSELNPLPNQNDFGNDNELDSTQILNQSAEEKICKENTVIFPLEAISSTAFFTIQEHQSQDATLDSDLAIEEGDVTCITIESSCSDGNEGDDNNIVEFEDGIAINNHFDSFCIEPEWKGSRKITALSTELKEQALNDKENYLLPKHATPINGKNSNSLQVVNKKSLSERNSNIRSASKLKSTEKRWRY